MKPHEFHHLRDLCHLWDHRPVRVWLHVESWAELASRVLEQVAFGFDKDAAREVLRRLEPFTYLDVEVLPIGREKVERVSMASGRSFELSNVLCKTFPSGDPPFIWDFWARLYRVEGGHLVQDRVRPLDGGR